MKRWLGLLIISTLTLTAGWAAAPDAPSQTQLLLGPELASFYYEEPGLMKETGAQYGAGASIRHYIRGEVMLEGALSFIAGNITYDGGIQNERGERISNIRESTYNSIFLARGLMGYRFHDLALGNVLFSLTPYSGLAWRFLYNDLASGSSYGYTREQNYIYLPLGLMPEIPLGGGWQLNLRAEVDLLLTGWNDSAGHHFSQTSGQGVLLSATVLTAAWKMGTLQMRGAIEPYYQYWNVSDSDTVQISRDMVAYEPANNSHQVGLRASLMF